MSTSSTFLEYVLGLYLDRDGLYWRCPSCQRTNGSVSVNEPLKDHAVKCRCRAVGCEWPVPGLGYGDEFDVLRWFHPGVEYPGLKLLRLDLWNKWNALRAEWVGRTGNVADTPNISPHGERSRYEREFDFEVADAWAGLLAAFKSPARPTPRAEYDEFARLVELGYFADLGRRFTEALLAYWLSFVEWVEASDRRHNETCSDAVCDVAGCRAKRGLPPLTADEITALWEVAEVTRARRLRRREEFMRDLRDHEVKEQFDHQQEDRT